MATKNSSGVSTPTDTSSIETREDERKPEYLLAAPEPLALSGDGIQRADAALGDAVLRFLRVRKGPPRYNLDAVSHWPMF